jgi:hypothetical protein
MNNPTAGHHEGVGIPQFEHEALDAYNGRFYQVGVVPIVYQMRKTRCCPVSLFFEHRAELNAPPCAGTFDLSHFPAYLAIMMLAHQASKTFIRQINKMAIVPIVCPWWLRKKAGHFGVVCR